MSPEKTEWEKPSPLREYGVRVEGRTLYVNAYYLANISKFFEKLFFPHCKEAKVNTISLPDEPYEKVLELLNVVTDVQEGRRKGINEENCSAMLRYADLWKIPSLRKSCEDFIWYVYPFSAFKLDRAIDIAAKACRHGAASSALRNLIGALASFGEETLLKANAFHLIPNPQCAALCSLAKKFHDYRLLCHQVKETVASKLECAHTHCGNRRTGKCTHCGIPFCSAHALVLTCHRREQTVLTEHTVLKVQQNYIPFVDMRLLERTLPSPT